MLQYLIHTLVCIIRHLATVPKKEEEDVGHANFLILVVLFLVLVTIRLFRRMSRRQKPELPDLLRSRLLKAKIVTRSM